ncbi:probable aminotransferase TAT2 isoform X2 [Hevea brasiliensis]|uniref:probable aminotransferase TAT2 isoform X2 n=1 Tax=Hevea brasiliensis TaxID=3981 RepID=UPI0025F479F8|nr:probable aminotransferase TAT2 isoform X2 [Hevea brasiliensis]
MEKVKESGTMNNCEVETPKNITIKGIISLLMQSVDEKCDRSVISLGMGDPSAYSCFHTTPIAQHAVVDAFQSDKFNGYSPTVGLPQTRRGLEVRRFDLLPDKGWEVDRDAIEVLADQNTVALVIINPGNPCGNVYSYQHLKEIADIAEKLKILVIADEVYGHLAFGKNPFVPMGVFGSTVPVLTLGSLSKRWIVPGWRLGWFVTTDPSGKFIKTKVVEHIKKYFDILGGPATFIQAAVPYILEQTDEVFFKKTINILKQASEICCDRIKEIPCITCPHKPQGSMAVMMKLNLPLLDDISDDIDFCFKLAKEESVIILPGTAVGLKDWLRITFAADPASLEEALVRVKSFCQRHTKFI